MSKTPMAAWFMLMCLALIWGSSFILIKKGLVFLTPQEVGSLRIVSGSLFLIPSAMKGLKKIKKSNIIPLFGAGTLGSLIPAFLFAIAQTKLASSITGVINALVPIFTILIGIFILGQRQNKSVYLGVAIGFIGTLILIAANNDGSFQGVNSYAILVVLATICYATNLNLIKTKLNDLHPLTVTSVSLLLVGPIAAIYLFGFTDFIHKPKSIDGAGMAILYICLLGVLGTAVAMIIFNKILQMTDALFTSSVTYIIPIIAVIWGLADGEKIDLIQYIGIVGVGVGVYIANKNRVVSKK